MYLPVHELYHGSLVVVAVDPDDVTKPEPVDAEYLRYTTIS